MDSLLIGRVEEGTGGDENTLLTINIDYVERESNIV